MRKRLDFTKPVSDDLIRECVAMALQAPSGGNVIAMRFVVIRDPEMIAAVAGVYAQCWDIYTTLPTFAGGRKMPTEERQAQQDRVVDSASYLAEHMGQAPALVIGCSPGRLDGVPGSQAAASLANILPAMWSFMLAARARGLGTAWTTIHLMMEEAVAEIVDIDFEKVQQVCLTPVAFTLGHRLQARQHAPTPTRSSTGADFFLSFFERGCERLFGEIAGRFMAQHTRDRFGNGARRGCRG